MNANLILIKVCEGCYKTDRQFLQNQFNDIPILNLPLSIKLATKNLENISYFSQAILIYHFCALSNCREKTAKNVILTCPV